MRLIILLGLLLGVLYSLHLLVKDYQALTAGKLLRLIFKRDTSQNMNLKPNVRWKQILLYDATQCTRYFYCELGTEPPDDDIRRGFIYMLKLETQEEEKSSQDVFKQAFDIGHTYGSNTCRNNYPVCPFNSKLLFKLVKYLLSHR